MKVQGCIFSWKVQEPRAAALERQIGALCPVTVINSEFSPEHRKPDWVHVGEAAYITAKWNKALQLFDGDVIFHAQADASSRQFAAILERCPHATQRHA